MAAQFTVQKSFEEKRLMANGIFTSGTGLGMLIISPVTNSLLNIYGFHGTLLVVSGIALHGIVFGLLMFYSLPYPRGKESRTIASFSASTELDEIAHGHGNVEKFVNNDKDHHIPDKNLKEKLSLKQATHVTQNYDSVKNSENQKQSSVGYDENKTLSRYLRLLKNRYNLIYTTGSVLSHTAMKAVIGIFFSRVFISTIHYQLFWVLREEDACGNVMKILIDYIQHLGSFKRMVVVVTAVVTRLLEQLVMMFLNFYTSTLQNLII